MRGCGGSMSSFSPLNIYGAYIHGVLANRPILAVFMFMAHAYVFICDFFSPVFSCNFDKDLCGFTQLKNDKFDWTQKSGSTSSSGTGPTSDVSGSGKKSA